jgi:hypothetical protein
VKPLNLFLFIQDMLILYIIGFLGFIARKKGILSRHATQDLTQLLLTFTLPFLILYSMGQPYDLSEVGIYFWLIPISCLILLVAIGLARFIKRKISLPDERKSVFEGLVLFGNQGFIGFAIIWSLFPEQGVLYVSLFNLPYLILIWTYGIYLFAGKDEAIPWRKLLFNPGILATGIGILIFFLPFHWPRMFDHLFEMVGNTTIPLSMLLIGTMIANINIKHSIHLLKDKTVWGMAATRLLLIPLLLFPLLFFSLPFPLLATAILVSATPAAPTIALYAQKYNGDTEYAAIGSACTTVLSVVTIPILYVLLSFFY